MALGELAMVSQDTLDAQHRIIEEATRLFVTLGYHGISMREIAEAAGVSKAGIYYHFKDKEELFLDILRINLGSIKEIIDQARLLPSAKERITMFVRNLFRQAPEQRAIIRLATQELAHISPEARAEFGRIYRESFVGQVELLLQEGIASGELKPMDVHTGTWLLLGMLYPFFYPSQEVQPEQTAKAIDLMLEVFFNGAAA
jgi:AcrR family transcriptional regulator